MTETVLDKFLRYVRINTQSDSQSQTYPSTAGQLRLLSMLVEEMTQIGVSSVDIDGYGYVTGVIPSNSPAEVPPIAFIAHVDTSPDVSGAGVSPRTVDYTGGNLAINSELSLDASTLSPYVGHRIVVSDGTTLLGADDKAGVAEIMAAAQHIIAHPELQHGDVHILFTPDEEVGRGVDYFDVAKFGARYAYTVDGGASGSLEWETFNAASARITLNGINYHPGYAKGKMVNSQYIAMDLIGRLPDSQRPETTSEREGFFHLTEITGSVEQTKLSYIIRDHDRAKFEERKSLLTDIVSHINNEYGCGSATIEIQDQYYNMGDVIRDHYLIVDLANRAMSDCGLTPRIEAVRGGTDGSRLSFMGLPCANIFSGAENIHSRLEFVSEQVMSSCVDVLVKIVVLFHLKALGK